MTDSEIYRARFRFRLEKKLNIEAKEYRFEVDSHKVILSPQQPDVKISDSNWLVMNSRGFKSEEAARKFVEKLKSACEISSVATRLGIDSGINLATSGFGQIVKNQVREQLGYLLRDNVHGVDVFLDNPNVKIACINATGTVRAAPDPFLNDINQLFEEMDKTTQTTRDIVLLLNYALMRPDPIAQIVFAFSAVEMLGQNEDWSNEQKQILDKLATSAQQMKIGSELERDEVATAIRKSLHKLTLRQGVVRLLTSLELEPLKDTWDNLYSQRSTLVHGLAPKPGVDYSNFAFKSVSLCGQILLAAISREITNANIHTEKFYKL